MSESVVGIVLISHSRALAEGAAELATQMGVGEVPVVAAGGSTDGEMGTSVDVVEQALHSADRGAGVVLVPDLGSAVLTAKTLLEDLAVEFSGSRIVMVDTPFIEGAVAAASAAGTGADLDTVVSAAEHAYDFRKL